MLAKVNPAQELKSIRGNIGKLQAQLAEVRAAQLPISEQTKRVRQHLQSLADAARERLVSSAARVISHEHSLADVTPGPSAQPMHAIGLAIMAAGVDNLVAEITARAQEQDTGCKRMSSEEKLDREFELLSRLYTYALDEEQLLDDSADRRPDAPAAAVLGVPYEIARGLELLEA